MRGRDWLARGLARLLIVLAVAVPAVGLPVGFATSSCAVSSLQTIRLVDGNVTRTLVVYRPPVPDSASLPVVYFLHGQPGQPDDFVKAGLVQEAAASATAGRPYVLVGLDGNGHRDDTEWADAKDGQDLIETFIVDRAIPAVEGANRRDRAHRTIAGFSMGGYGAANIALRHPSLFGAFASFSGYFHIDDPDGVFDNDEQWENANRPDLNAAAARGMNVLLVEGDSDIPLVRGEAARMAPLLARAGAHVTTKVLPGGHEWRIVREVFPLVAQRLLPAYVPSTHAVRRSPARRVLSPTPAPSEPACGRTAVASISSLRALQ